MKMFHYFSYLLLGVLEKESELYLNIAFEYCYSTGNFYDF